MASVIDMSSSCVPPSLQKRGPGWSDLPPSYAGALSHERKPSAACMLNFDRSWRQRIGHCTQLRSGGKRQKNPRLRGKQPKIPIAAASESQHPTDSNFVKELSELAIPFKSVADLSKLFNELKNARVVMLGEATHGTHEFYEWRRLISQELIDKHGFRFIAIEGEWPPSQNVNGFINQVEEHPDRYKNSSVSEVLHSFKRWPTWTFRNTELQRMVAWMWIWNSKVNSPENRVGFYGLDIFSLAESIKDAVTAMERIDPILAKKARLRYECFNPYLRKEWDYARSLISHPKGCEEGLGDTLEEMLQKRRNSVEPTAFLEAVQSARIVKSVEKYYRCMFQKLGGTYWNVRVHHMMDTVRDLLDHYGPLSKGIVWSHNLHIGDYKASSLSRDGYVNLGGLAREELGRDAVKLVGFSTYRGTVFASQTADGPGEILTVPPCTSMCWELDFHLVAGRLNEGRLAFVFGSKHREGCLAEMRGHRHITAVYKPNHDWIMNYVPTSLANRYDALLFLDRTVALQTLFPPELSL